MDKSKIINSLKNAYSSIRIANVKPTGVLATRALVALLLIPIVLVVVAFTYAFITGKVSDDAGRLIDVGIKIIDHVFIPAVLTTLAGFLALFIDKNNNGIPDKLEDKEDNR